MEISKPLNSRCDISLPAWRKQVINNFIWIIRTRTGTSHKMSSLLNFSDGLHQCIPARDTNIGSRIGRSELSKFFEVTRDQFTFYIPHVKFEECFPCRRLGKRDIDSPFETTPDSRIKNPRNICCAQDCIKVYNYNRKILEKNCSEILENSHVKIYFSSHFLPKTPSLSTPTPCI